MKIDARIYSESQSRERDRNIAEWDVFSTKMTLFFKFLEVTFQTGLSYTE